MKRIFFITIRRLLEAYRAAGEYMRPIGPVVFKDLKVRDVIIREATDDAIGPLESFLSSGDFSKHGDRLKAQKSGAGEYLIAWHLIPVGHVFIIWNGGGEGPLAHRREKEPLIEDLYVHPVVRRKGIGKMLMDEAEELIRKRGSGAVGLTISTNNPGVEAMYEKRGYRESNLGAFISHRIFRDKAGREKTWSSKVTYWVKVLESREHGSED